MAAAAKKVSADFGDVCVSEFQISRPNSVITLLSREVTIQTVVTVLTTRLIFTGTNDRAGHSEEPFVRGGDDTDKWNALIVNE